MRQPMVAGNWKMQGDRASLAELINGIVAGRGDIDHADVVVCPPYVFLAEIALAIGEQAIGLGAQNVCDQSSGAFTGEIAASMLRSIGCGYVIVGHSERRTLYAETDAAVARKYQHVQSEELTPILCVGETREERESGRTQSVVARQLDAVIELNGVGSCNAAVLAYEPIWAIGTGLTASPEQADEVHRFIRERVSDRDADVAETLRILYGGSVKPDNATALFAMPHIDGGLIGGASLNSADFLAICRAAG